MKTKIYKIAIVSSLIVAGIIGSCFVGGIILGANLNVLACLFFGAVGAFTISAGIAYAFGDSVDRPIQNYDIPNQTKVRCNDGINVRKREKNEVFLVDYNRLGLNCESKAPEKNNVKVKVRKRTRND